MCVYLCTALPVIRKLKSRNTRIYSPIAQIFCNEGTHNVKIQYKYFTLHSVNHTTAVPKRANKPSCTPLRGQTVYNDLQCFSSPTVRLSLIWWFITSRFLLSQKVKLPPQTSQQISADIKKADFISLQQVQVIKSAFDRKGMVMRTQWFAITIKA